MDATSPWNLGGLTWTELGKRVWSEINEDDVFGRAAQLAYYFLLALFPLLLFVISLLGYFVGENSELQQNLLGYLGAVVPAEASQLIKETVVGVSKGAGGGKLSFGILAALWAASNGMGALSQTLNVAYNVEERRSWWKTRLISIGLTIAIAILIITALVGILYGHSLAEFVADKFGLGTVFEWTWKIVQWPVILAFVLLAFGLIYYFAPDLRQKSWRWVTPGAVLGLVLWLLVSFGFSLYLNHFNSYNATYGSLGAVIILMLWFYLSGAAILIGGEVNSEIENAAAQAGTPDAREKGEKAPNEKGDKKANARQTSDRQQQPAVTANADAREMKQLVMLPNQPSREYESSSSSSSRVEKVGAHRPLTLRKVAVVAGAWVVAKLTGGRIDKR